MTEWMSEREFKYQVEREVAAMFTEEPYGPVCPPYILRMRTTDQSWDGAGGDAWCASGGTKD